MSKNIKQIFDSNPTTSMQGTDLLYLGRSPYDTTDDFAITYANFQSSISPVVVVTGATQAMTTNIIYIANRSSLITFTLPTTAAIGDTLSVIGQGVGGWIIDMGTGQQVIVGSSETTATTGSVASTNKSDALNLMCITANTLWTTLNAPQGNLTIV